MRSVDNYFQGCVRKSVSALNAFNPDNQRSSGSRIPVEHRSLQRSVSRSASVSESLGRASTVSDDSLPFSSISACATGVGSQGMQSDRLTALRATMTTGSDGAMDVPPGWARDIVLNPQDKSRMLRSFFSHLDCWGFCKVRQGILRTDHLSD